MNVNQNVDLTRPLIARPGPAPVAIQVSVTPSTASIAGGVPMSSTRTEAYVLLSALPGELRERVILAIQALRTAG